MRLVNYAGKFIGPAGLGVFLLAAPAAIHAQELKSINVLTANEATCGSYPQHISTMFGYFAEEGVKVNLLSSDTAVPYVAFLANGDADIVSIDPGQVLQAVTNDQPLAVVYELQQFQADGLAVMAESDIQSLADMKGKIIGMTSDRDLVTTTIALNSAGLEITDVTTVIVGDSGPVLAKALRDGTIHAFSGGNTDRSGVEAAGMALRNITPVEVSMVPGNSFAVWKPTLEEKRPLIQAFLRGWAKGSQAGVIDHKAIMSACKQRIPEQWEIQAVGEKLLNYSIYVSGLRRTMLLGELQPDVWANLQEPLVRLGELKAAIDPATFLDGSFIKAANEFTTEDVKKGIRKWKEENKDSLL